MPEATHDDPAVLIAAQRFAEHRQWLQDPTTQLMIGLLRQHNRPSAATGMAPHDIALQLGIVMGVNDAIELLERPSARAFLPEKPVEFDLASEG